MARFTWDAMYEQLTPLYGGVPLWQSTQDMLDAFWLSRGYADAPQGDALYAFYVAQGAVGVTLGDLENDYWDRIGPNVLVGLGATLVLDARNSKVGEQWALNMGSGGQVLRAKYGSVARAEIRNGVGLVLPSSAGNVASTPNVAVSWANGFDVWVRGSADVWSGSFGMAGHGSGSAHATRSIGVGITGAFVTALISNGTTTIFPSVATPGAFTPGRDLWVWINARLVTGTMTTTFKWADGSSSVPSAGWTTFGSDSQAFTGPINGASLPFAIGDFYSPSGTPFPGVIKRTVVADGNGVTVLDTDFTKPADFTTSFVCDTGQTVTVTAANAVDTNDPLFLPHTGVNHMFLPGLAGNFASTPDTVATSPTGDFEVVVRAGLTSWTPGGTNALFNKQQSFSLLVNPSGQLEMAFTADGAAYTGFATPSHGFTNGVNYWVKMTRVKSTGLTTIYSAPDSETEPTSWTTVGSSTVSAGNNPFDAGAATEIGSVNGGVAFFSNGRFYRGILRDGIGGTTVLDVDFTKNTSQSSFVCTTGQTVTINRATSGRKTVVVTRPVWLFGTDDYMEVADNALLDFGADEDLTLISIWRMHGAGGGFMAFMSKTNPDTYLTNGYLQGRNSGDRGTFFQAYLNDGLGHATTIAAQAYTDGAISVFASSRSGSTGSHVKNNGTPNTVGSVNASMANSQPFRLGQNPVGSGMPIDGECLAVAVFRRALTPAEIAQIVAAFGAS